MQKRVADITQSFEHCRFEDSLRQIAELQRKLDPKKKNKITDNEASVIAVIKAGSLAGVGQLHQAHALMNRQFPTIDNINHDLAFLFLQICQISMDSRTEKFLQQLDQKHKEKDPNLRRFSIQFRQFSKLSKYYLKQYTTTKKPQSSLNQIAMQYYNTLNTNNMINFARDPTIQEKPQLKMKLKMVEMFMMKFVQQMNEKQLSGRIHKATTDLRLRLAIHGGNCKLAKELFEENKGKYIEEPFRFLRSIRKMAGVSEEQRKDNLNFYIKGCLEVFRTNLNLQKYTPFYDYYNEFLQTMLSQMIETDIGSLVQTLSKTTLQKQQLYIFKDTIKQQFINYYQSLHSEYADHISNKQTLGKQDYYRICIKGLLLQLIKIQSLNNKISHNENQILKQFVRQYRDFLGKTLTYPMQIGQFGTLIDSELPTTITQQDDKLIYSINMQKIFGKKDIKTIQQLQTRWKQCEQLYEKNVNEVEKIRFLEKGQKYLSDDFIVILADVVRKFVQSNDTVSPQQRISYIMGMISLLEKCAQKSPYNFDLKLRLINFYGKVNYFDNIIDVYAQMDIKSVQYETLGFWILKPIIQFNLEQNNDLLLIKMMRSYQQNFRQCAQYALKSIDKISYNQVEQYLSYQNNHRRSYNRIILIFALLLKNRRKPNSQFYLQKILQIFQSAKSQGKQLTLNCDFKTISSQVYPEDNFVDFFGVYNNCFILKEQCMMRMAEYDIINKKQHIADLKDRLILKKWQLKDLFAFENYEIFQRKLTYKLGSNPILQQQLTVQLNFHCEIMCIRYCSLLLANQMLKQSQQPPQVSYEQLLKLFEQLYKNFNENLQWRKQSKLIFKLRSHLLDIYFLFQAIIDELKKNKKTFKGVKKNMAELCENIKVEVIKIMTECKFQARDKIQKQWYAEDCIKRDDILERITTINAQEMKKIYHL